MFGLEDSSVGKKKGKKGDFTFDLEKDMKNLKKFREVTSTIQGRVDKIKTLLRSGENKESFDTLGVLLHGYQSLAKVLSRAVKKK